MNFLRKLFAKLFGRLLRRAPLCDRCRYDYGTVCMRPERPNAIVCPDFKQR